MIGSCCEKLNRLNQYATLPLRLVLGIVFFAHGADKLFGWFGGGGLSETAQIFQHIGLQPAMVQAILAGGGEMFGGILVFFGLFTRVGAFLIAATMTVAIVKVHLVNGLFARDNGFEYPLTALGAALSLLCSGAPVFSLDSIFCPLTKANKSCCEPKSEI